MIVGGCEDGPKRAYDAGAGRGEVPSATAATAAVPPHAVVESGKPHVKLPCRAIAVSGAVKIFPSIDAMGARGSEDAGLALMDTLPFGSIVGLADGGRITVKSPATSRETGLQGPARAMLCVDAEEKTWLFDGTFEGTVGAGEAPGSEEWVFSLFGVVRYGSSNLTLHASAHRLEVNVISGSAWLFAPTFASESGPSALDGGAIGERWRRADPGFSLVLGAKDAKSDDRRAADATTACTSQATETRKIAQSLAGHDMALATAANAHVLARRDARALCGVAAVWVANLPTSAKRVELAEKVSRANDVWQKID